MYKRDIDCAVYSFSVMISLIMNISCFQPARRNKDGELLHALSFSSVWAAVEGMSVLIFSCLHCSFIATFHINPFSDLLWSIQSDGYDNTLKATKNCHIIKLFTAEQNPRLILREEYKWTKRFCGGNDVGGHCGEWKR